MCPEGWTFISISMIWLDLQSARISVPFFVQYIDAVLVVDEFLLFVASSFFFFVYSFRLT